MFKRERLFDLLELNQCSPARTQKTLSSARRIASTLRGHGGKEAIVTLRTLLDRVTVAAAEIQVALSSPGIRNMLGLKPSLDTDDASPSDRDRYSIRVLARLKRCGSASRLIITDDKIGEEKEPDTLSIRVLCRAHDRFASLATGKAQSAAVIALDEGLTRSYVTRVMRLALLAPDIAEAILAGRQPPDLNAERLVRRSWLPMAWENQRRLLGSSQR